MGSEGHPPSLRLPIMALIGGTMEATTYVKVTPRVTSATIDLAEEFISEVIDARAHIKAVDEILTHLTSTVIPVEVEAETATD